VEVIVERGFAVAIVVTLAAAAVGYIVLKAKSKPSGRFGPRAAYSRTESDAVRAFYQSYAKVFDETPADLLPLIAKLEQASGVARAATEFPISPQALSQAARAFEVAALEAYQFRLSVDVADPEQLDRFANTFLIDPALRPYFDGAGPRELPEEESRGYFDAVESLRVPNEPLLYYCMGAFWGEWLVRHRQAVWALYPPLKPIQSFPDMISASNTLCAHPFSQVNKKLSDPEGDQLAYKAKVMQAEARYLPPLPLIASLADAEEAALATLPPFTRAACDLEKSGDADGALRAYAEAIASNGKDLRTLSLAVQAAWQGKRWEFVEHWSLAALRSAPTHPVFSHNLAVLYAGTPGRLNDAVKLLETALRTNPAYGRGHLTLASCLFELGDRDAARAEAMWVIENDPQLRSAAEEFLKEAELGGTPAD